MDRRYAVLNEKGERQCPKCKGFFPPTPEHFYFGKGKIRSYCKPCDYQRKVGYLAPATEASMLKRYREHLVSTSELFAFLSERRGEPAALQIVDRERRALGLPGMRAEAAHE